MARWKTYRAVINEVYDNNASLTVYDSRASAIHTISVPTQDLEEEGIPCGLGIIIALRFRRIGNESCLARIIGEIKPKLPSAQESQEQLRLSEVFE